MRVINTLAFAAGHWRIERVLDDHRSGTEGRFAGRAALTGPDLPGGPLQYLETGELRFGTHTGPATRALRYQGLPDGTVDVRFADGHHFYRLDLRSGRCTAVHQCGADRYEITYLVLSDERRWKSAGGCADRTRTTRRPRP